MPENSVETDQLETKKSGNNKIIIVIGIIVILLLLAVIVILLLRKPTESSDTPLTPATEPQREVLVSKDNVDEIVEQMEQEIAEYTPPGYYTAQMNSTWHFATGDSESYDSYVANASENTSDVYFDLYLSDDMENPIYQSPVLPVGTEIRNIRLNKDLEQGTYESVLVYTLVDENQKSQGTVSFTVTLIVEK
jgi:hypothetical protein